MLKTRLVLLLTVRRKGRNYLLTPPQFHTKKENSRIPEGVERFTLVNGLLTHVHGRRQHKICDACDGIKHACDGMKHACDGMKHDQGWNIINQTATHKWL